MSTEIKTVTDARKLLSSALIGTAAWQVLLGHGMSATLDFGEVVPPIGPGRPSRGSLHLWISGACWRIEASDGAVVTGNQDSGSTMADGLRRLDKMRVTSVSLPPSTRDLLIQFESDLRLRTFRCSTEEDAWRFFSPAGALFLDESGECRFEPACAKQASTAS